MFCHLWSKTFIYVQKYISIEKVKVKEGSHMNMIYQKQFYAFQFDFMMINRRTNVYFCED